MLGDTVLRLVGEFSYPAVFLLLVACGLGFPFSEDVIVIAGGTAVAAGDGSFVLMAMTAFAGKLVGDSLIFRMGRKLGPRVFENRRFARLFTPARVRWIGDHFQRWGMASVIAARFLPGLRAPTYLAAGASGFSFGLFVLADALAAACSAPLMTFLGFRFGLPVLKHLHQASGPLLAGVGALVLAWLLIRWRRRRLRTGPVETPETGPSAREK